MGRVGLVVETGAQDNVAVRSWHEDGHMDCSIFAPGWCMVIEQPELEVPRELAAKLGYAFADEDTRSRALATVAELECQLKRLRAQLAE